MSACLLLQLPHQLGLLGSSLVAVDPYKSGALLPLSVANTVDTFIGGLHKAGFGDHLSH
jgi:hypothetical protein